MLVGMGVCSLVCVCECARYRERDHVIETVMTCRRVNKINNIRLFSLFNKITNVPLVKYNGRGNTD